MSDQPKRIAMWSGPRSLSTVLMRAWENRHDTTVWDEPLFPPFLLMTGDNSYSEEVFAKYETNWAKVMNQMTNEPIPDGKAIHYQKHISAFLLPDQMGMDWLAKLSNCILIREPSEMLISLFQKRPDITTFEQTGIMQLKLIFQYVYRTIGSIPPIIDARDLQQNPCRTLSLLCEAVGVEFTEAMLSWPAGSHTTDGIWAKNFYDSVEKSTGFRPYKPKTNSVPDHLLGVLEQCNEIYWELYQYRLH
ncbi:MAG TPA: hypothetical protein EYP59_13490 [Thiotrichaceae bacterium]|nr:hypothetical protein [Thiotrichaceae bacterium]